MPDIVAKRSSTANSTELTDVAVNIDVHVEAPHCPLRRLYIDAVWRAR